MSFLTHQEIFPSEGCAIALDRAPAHRLDEFLAGHSSAGCAPAVHASASPSAFDLCQPRTSAVCSLSAV